jgi:DNA-binding response OmpR family regulator
LAEERPRPRIFYPLRLVFSAPSISLTVLNKNSGLIGFAMAASAAASLSISRKYTGEIDLVLLDLVLEGMTAVETLRELRSLRPAIRAILTSGFGRQESLAGFTEMRLDGFLSKPFGYTELENAVRVALGRGTADEKEG